jgi:hypothetical protein
MRRAKIVAIVVLTGLASASGQAPPGGRAHPRIWLTAERRSALSAKVASNDAEWARLKARADRLLDEPTPRFTVTGATNANPVQFTMAEPISWPATTSVFIAGATGGWAGVNASGDRPRPIAATRISDHRFSVPIDSTAFGPFERQRLVLFFSDGSYSAYGYEGEGWQSALETLGLAYQMTGRPAYASKGIALLSYIASLGDAGMIAPEAIDAGFPSRSAVLGLAIGFDWFHDRLTVDQKASVGRTINLWFDWYERAAFERAGPAYGNYFGGHVLGFGLAGLVTDGENPRGREIAVRIRDLFQTRVEAAFRSGAFEGGYPVESYAYGANHFQRLLAYMLALRSATGEDLFARTAYAQSIARGLLYNVKPNGWQVSDEGDFPGDETGVLQPSLPILLAHVLVGEREGAWMQYFVQHLPVAPHGGQSDDPVTRFLWFDGTRASADYRATEPTWFYSPGDAHLYRRSSWQSDAVWMSFAGGAANWASHQMRAAGHVAIQRGGDALLVNAGQWKGTTGDAGMPQVFDLRSWRANTLFADDFGDYLFTGVAYAGGQGYWGVNRVLAHDGGPEFGYLKADLTTAYSVGDRRPANTQSVQLFHRSALATGNGVVVLFDRIRFRKAHYVKKLYFHVNPSSGPPVLVGNTAWIRVGRSALFLRTLLPDVPRLAATGDPVSATDHRTATYRLEVSDSLQSTTFDALHVLIATPSSTIEMPATLRLRSNDRAMVGAMVADGNRQRVILFASNGTPQAGVTYAAHYRSPQIGTHVIVDLLPNVRYRIARDGTDLGVTQASDQGVIAFSSSGGGTFAVRAESIAPADGKDRP